MANYKVSDTDLTAVADAIRQKGGTGASLVFPAGFVSAIGAIPTGGGSSQETALLDGSISGAYENGEVITLRAQAFAGCSGLTSISLPELKTAAANAFINCTNVTSVHLPKLQKITENYTFSNMKKLVTIALPSIAYGLGNFAFSGCTLLSAADFGAGVGTMGGQSFANTALQTLVIRKNGVSGLPNNLNTFNGTPFASGGTGGTLYVPQAAISAYQADTNWSTILGYANNQILPIEGSIYETQYVDGTPIA